MNLRDFFNFADTKGKVYNKVLSEIIEINSDILYGSDEIKPFLEQLSSCDEFSRCKIKLMDYPVEIINGNIVQAETVKISEKTRFQGTCHLLSVSLCPTIHDPVTFEPSRAIMVRGVFDQ